MFITSFYKHLSLIIKQSYKIQSNCYLYNWSIGCNILYNMITFPILNQTLISNNISFIKSTLYLFYWLNVNITYCFTLCSPYYKFTIMTFNITIKISAFYLINYYIKIKLLWLLWNII